MLPFFATAGRRAYTRCITVYLHELEKLDEYTEKSFKDGLFVVRNSKEPYGGVSPDLAIEQKLMAPLKGHGGLTRGRGMTESTRTQ